MVRASIRRRSGLTLMELIVVLAILVALAGILIPIFSGLIGRSETSARATNHQEISKAIQTYEATYTRYPNDFDSLTDGTTTPLTYVSGASGATPAMAITALTATQSVALNAGGITRLQLMMTTPASPGDDTFSPYLDQTDRASATGSLAITKTGTPNLMTLTSLGQFQLNLSDNSSTSTGTYVVLGLGKRCSIVGYGMGEAPVNFFDNAALSPNTRYSRYGVVFQVSGFNTNSTSGAIIDFSRARYVRSVRFGNPLVTGDDAINSYWQDVAGGNGS